MKNRIGCRNPDRWIAAFTADELLPRGPTEDFTRHATIYTSLQR
jgi:hypothetical protein